jgi:hypothetical protein
MIGCSTFKQWHGQPEVQPEVSLSGSPLRERAFHENGVDHRGYAVYPPGLFTVVLR